MTQAAGECFIINNEIDKQKELLLEGYTIFKTFIISEPDSVQEQNTEDSSEVDSDDDA